MESTEETRRRDLIRKGLLIGAVVATIDLIIARADGTTETVSVTVRIDTPIEVEYYRHGGILPYVLREILKQNVPQRLDDGPFNLTHIKVII